jgi:putative transposase
MPEHVHLVVHPVEFASDIEKVLFAIKRPYSFRVKQQLEREDHPLLKELTIRQRPGVLTFRFWQEGPRYDRNLTSEKAIQAAIRYVHMNPVRRKLCERATDWRWSSAKWYETDGAAVDLAWPKLTALPSGFFHVGAQGGL